MATQAHCACCWESLVAHYEHRRPLDLATLERLWDEYHSSSSTPADTISQPSDPRPAAITRLLNHTSASSSSSSLQSPASSTQHTSGTATPASSIDSTSRVSPTDDYPLFVTWNTTSSSGKSTLRGCIGTFQAQPLEHGLQSYALTSALHDERFRPIPASSLPTLDCHVTLLTNFSSPTRDPLAWTIGQHGIRISFQVSGRRLSATYLPDVIVEQGWTKEEALASLMRKGGWSGSAGTWRKVWDAGRGELVTYEGNAVGLRYAEWERWREWVRDREEAEE